MRKLKSNGSAERGTTGRIALALLMAAMALGGATQAPTTATAAHAAPASALVDRQDSIAQPSSFGSAAATAAMDLPTGPAAVTATSEDAAPSETPASTAQTVNAPVAPIAPAAPVVIAPAPAAAAAPAPAAPAAGCEVAFCYPRLGIAGGIAPYNDCTGKTDIGTRIVQLNCTTPTYLMGHAYTQFGRIVNWQAGDQVWVYGTRFTVYDAVITHCGAWPPPAGVLRMQTSLSSGCGDVLVVLAR